jgi:hypothetical protein
MKTKPGEARILQILLVGLFVAFSANVSKAQPNGRGLAISNNPVKVLPPTSKRYAIVIGVDTYADTQITTLGGASNDASALAKALIQYGGFPEEQVTLLASQSGTSVQIVIGNSYSVLQGTLEGNVMKGEGTNQEGVSWKWTLFKQQ